MSVKCGGRDDLNKHVEMKLHRQIAQTVQTTSPMTLFVTTDSDTEVTHAEMLFSYFLIEHNLPVRPLFKQMFGDSKVVGVAVGGLRPPLSSSRRHARTDRTRP